MAHARYPVFLARVYIYCCKYEACIHVLSELKRRLLAKQDVNQ